jgi:hypothetical protein
VENVMPPSIAHLTVRAARDQYLADNGFTTAGYTAPTFTLPFLGFNVPVPNPPARQAAVARHDLHHILVGYGTDYPGEAEIGVWELRAGCNTAFLKFINTLAVLGGGLIAPLRVWRAWRRARGCRTLYVDGLDYKAALDMRVVDLRRRLGIPDEGLVASTIASATRSDEHGARA